MKENYAKYKEICVDALNEKDKAIEEENKIEDNWRKNNCETLPLNVKNKFNFKDFKSHISSQ
jgi:hypothetical protein